MQHECRMLVPGSMGTYLLLLLLQPQGSTDEAVQ